MTIDRPHVIYSHGAWSHLTDGEGNTLVYPTLGHAQREARKLSRAWWHELNGEPMPREVDLDWHNGFAAAFYRVEPLEE